MFNDILHFLKSITFIDYVFFFAIIFLIVLVVCLLYFIRINADVIKEDKVGDDMEDLRKIAQDLSNTEPPKPVKFTSYEKEQEEKAIISYDELLSSTGQFELNYSDEEVKDDITVRKVDLENLINLKKTEPIKPEIHMLSLEKEEAFLNALKELQQKLI